MPTIDRLNKIRLQKGLPVVRSPTSAYISENGQWVSVAPLHVALDELDKLTGIRTRHGSASAYFAGAVPFPQSEYVGARLARLERHVDANKEPAMFWLGAEGDTQLRCGAEGEE